MTTTADLRNIILELEYKQIFQLKLLKKGLLNTYEELKPINVLKNTLRHVVSAPDIKENLVGSTLGLTAGYLIRSIIVGASVAPVKKLIGSLLEVGFAKIVSHNPTTLKSIVAKTLSFINPKK